MFKATSKYFNDNINPKNILYNKYNIMYVKDDHIKFVLPKDEHI